ncbi:hypothetical protein K7X08_002778 [Anisodus acutangulus]|uniref:Uncharacterized protein n=1 Tax=Anisodus acutangulus TaxID=402998 RepID=A0A9Q1MCU6_9SOLA|nr:hypothetical protein K7X08_002778 [Anisodus acutangulus]
MSLDHYSSVKKERVCIVYFLMKGLPINIGYLILKEMKRVRECKSKRLTYRNTLTIYMMIIKGDLAHLFDRVLDPLDSMIDISKVLALGQSVKHNLTPVEECSGKYTLITQIHKIMVIQGEHFRLYYLSVYAEAPHIVYSRALLGEDARLPEDEVVCLVDQMMADLAVGKEVESQPQGDPDDGEEEEKSEPEDGEDDEEED